MHDQFRYSEGKLLDRANINLKCFQIKVESLLPRRRKRKKAISIITLCHAQIEMRFRFNEIIIKKMARCFFPNGWFVKELNRIV